MNPILPKNYFIPDVEARVWEDGHVYLYGSSDICGNTDYCSDEYRVFSSADLKNWKDHGISFTSEQAQQPAGADWSPLYAPDCIRYKGKYYLFYCQADHKEGVAVSEKPCGPFQNIGYLELGDRAAIDPAAFVDDDGTIYYFWGQINAYGAILDEHMRIIPGSIREHILTREEHDFHEGISIRKRKGIYYLIYTDTSRGRATCLAYAVSRSPLGPYEKKGIIIDNTGCDPSSWNNHGSIQEINGQWYVFYHRSTHNSNYSRRVCAEPIFFDENGEIAEVEMTTQGMEDPLVYTTNLEASQACRLYGKLYAATLTGEDRMTDYLTHIETGDMAVYKYLNFTSSPKRIEIEASSMTYGGEVEVYLDRPEGESLCSIRIERSGSWFDFMTYQAEIKREVEGIHAVILLFKGKNGRVMNLRRFVFS